MCMPSMPKMPKMEDPILPQQALNASRPAKLAVGRGDVEDDKKLRQNRSRRKLRISKDAGKTTAGGGGGVQTPGAA